MITITCLPIIGLVFTGVMTPDSMDVVKQPVELTAENLEDARCACRDAMIAQREQLKSTYDNIAHIQSMFIFKEKK